MTYGQIVGLTFIIFGQIMVLILVSRIALLLSTLAYEDIQKHDGASNYIADMRGVEVNASDNKKDRVIGFK